MSADRSSGWRRWAAVVVLTLGTVACSEAKEHARNRFVPGEPGVLKVAADLPSPGFREGDNPATVSGGFEWGIAQALTDAWDLQLEVVDVPFTEIEVGEGLHLAIAADAPVAVELTARLGRQPAVTTGLTEWLREHVRPNDLVVLPGGRNGALFTTRTRKLVASLGASIAVVADATSVAPAERASQSLGLVTGRRSAAG